MVFSIYKRGKDEGVEDVVVDEGGSGRGRTTRWS